MVRRALVTLTLLGGVALTSALPAGLFEPAAAARVARPSAAPVSDTMEVSASAGQALVHTLPRTVGGRAVNTYRLLRGPALSGVAGRSLTWIPRRTAPGAYTLLLEARRSDAPPDTLVVRVDMRE